MKWKSNVPSEETDDSKIITIGGFPPNNDVPEGNKIYLYEEISRQSVLSLIKQIDAVSKTMKTIQFTYDLPEPPPVEIHICSEGGDAISCMAAVDKITNNPVPIHTYVEGMAASAATLISVSGHKRFITPNSRMLIHQLSSGMWGSYNEFKDEMENIESLMEMIRNIYIKKTKFKARELEKLLSHDLFLGAEKCLSMGLIDEIK